MIPATHPCQAVYRVGTKRTSEGMKIPAHDIEPVVAWNHDGEALIVGTHGLELAHRRKGFVRIQLGRPPVVGMLPADGSVVVFKDEDRNGEAGVETALVRYWLVREDGDCDPYYLDAEGVAWNAHEDSSVAEVRMPD